MLTTSSLLNFKCSTLKLVQNKTFPKSKTMFSSENLTGRSRTDKSIVGYLIINNDSSVIHHTDYILEQSDVLPFILKTRAPDIDNTPYGEGHTILSTLKLHLRPLLI